jgi:sugar lactone lactonase YvrE
MKSEGQASFEPIVTGFYLEGLLVDGDDIWFTDVTVGGVHKVGSDTVLLPDRSMIGGLARNEDGCLLVAGVGGIAWVETTSGRSGKLVEGLDGANEMRADGRGGLFFGTIDLPGILEGKRPGPSTIQHLSRDRKLTQLWGGLTFANGLAISPDRTTLYFNESFSATRAFPIKEDGVLGKPRTLIEMADCDGMALDADGNIWVCGFSSGELRCVTPQGEEVHRLSLPGNACTNIRFGGKDLRDLYVTVVDTASAQALAEGRPLTTRNSTLYRTRSPVPGAPIETTGFQL